MKHSWTKRRNKPTVTKVPAVMPTPTKARGKETGAMNRVAASRELKEASEGMRISPQGSRPARSTDSGIAPPSTKRSLGHSTSTDSATLVPKKTHPGVRLTIDMAGYRGPRLHEVAHTCLDLKSYLRRIPRGLSLASRSRIWVHEPVVRGPLRLYDVPQPGELVVLHEADYSIAPSLGQRGMKTDAEVRASMVHIAQASLNAAVAGRDPVITAEELMSRVVVAKPPREQS